MTGIDDPYEAPELRLDGTESIPTAADQVLAALHEVTLPQRQARRALPVWVVRTS